MVRTMSARLRRSFGDYVDTALLVRSRAVPQRRLLMIASLLQSVLLVGLTIYAGIEGSAQSHAAGPALGTLALLTAGYVGYATLTGTSESGAIEEDATPPHPGAAHFARFKDQISHELRTPLNAVIGFSEMMQRELLGPVGNDRYREYAAHIRQSAVQFQNATEKTLEFAAMLGAPAAMEQQEIPLSAVIGDRIAACPEFNVCCNFWGMRQAFECLDDGAMQLAGAAAPSKSTIRCERDREGATIIVTVCGSQVGATLAQPEALPGFELNLLLARLHVEGGGGRMEVIRPDEQTWVAIVRLRSAEAAGMPH